MASHGIPRASAEASAQTAEARAKSIRKIQAYRSLENELRIAIRSNAYNQDTMTLLSRLLSENPEYYTIWNYRRQVLVQLMSRVEGDNTAASDQDANKKLLVADMEFLLPLLIRYPKCYWIWKHRFWLLEQFSKQFLVQTALKAWQGEFALVNKMLNRDNRNFHGWHYRRRVVSEMRRLFAKIGEEEEKDVSGDTKALTEQEFEYTTKCIKADLSNFSAWHHRSKIIPRLLDERAASVEQRIKFFDGELAFIKDALFDPVDQSLWYYHRYLMSILISSPRRDADDQIDGEHWVSFDKDKQEKYLETEIEDIRDMLEDFPDVKLIYQNLLEYAAQYLSTKASTGLLKPQDMRSWMNRLKELDPLRVGEWRDLEMRLHLRN